MVEIIVEAANGVALGALGSSTALIIDSTHATALLTSFLMKKVRAMVKVVGAAVGDEALVCGMARGDVTVGQILTALTGAQLERDNVGQAQRRVVAHETVTPLVPNGDGTTMTAIIEASLGGGKGIPFEDGDGWQWFVYNAGSGALTTGSTAILLGTYWGVWL